MLADHTSVVVGLRSEGKNTEGAKESAGDSLETRGGNVGTEACQVVGMQAATNGDAITGASGYTGLVEMTNRCRVSHLATRLRRKLSSGVSSKEQTGFRNTSGKRRGHTVTGPR